MVVRPGVTEALCQVQMVLLLELLTGSPCDGALWERGIAGTGSKMMACWCSASS